MVKMAGLFDQNKEEKNEKGETVINATVIDDFRL